MRFMAGFHSRIGIVHFLRCLLSSQIDNLKHRIVIREDLSVLDGFSNHRTQGFNRIGSIDDPANFIRIIEQVYQVSPV